MRNLPNAEVETEQPGKEDRHPAEEQPGEIMISYPPTPDSLNNVRVCLYCCLNCCFIKYDHCSFTCVKLFHAACSLLSQVVCPVCVCS